MPAKPGRGPSRITRSTSSSLWTRSRERNPDGRGDGRDHPCNPYLATALGEGHRVSALEMASAYATFAASGIHREPYAVELVDKSNFGESESVYDHKLEGRRVLSGNQAAAGSEVLRRVVQSGTASFYHNLDSEIGRPSAGKTGTTDDFVARLVRRLHPRLSTAF